MRRSYNRGNGEAADHDQLRVRREAGRRVRRALAVREVRSLWNTTQIPVEEYELLLRRVRRHKLEALGLAGGAAAVLVPLIIFVSATFIGLVPLAMMGWLLVFLPRWRRRYRRTARTAPRWQLHPD